MKTINIYSKEYTCSILCMLRVSGYKDKNENELILEDENGRFHAKIVGKRAYIHYDLLVGYKHKVFSMPIALKLERDRILDLNKGFKIKEKTLPDNKYWVKYQQQKKRELKQLKKRGVISPISPFKKYI